MVAATVDEFVDECSVIHSRFAAWRFAEVALAIMRMFSTIMGHVRQ